MATATDVGSPRSKLRHAVSTADIGSRPLSPSPSPPLNSIAMPRSRSISPSPARLSCPPLYRDFSDTSSASTLSTRSSNSRSVSGSTIARRRGYVRPQGAQFAESAKNRESVMSLGSIAHLQYYFARTGLLDGKGAQARDVDTKKKRRPDLSVVPGAEGKENVNPSILGDDYAASPSDYDPMSPEEWDSEEIMLPPTVSTYAQRIPYVEPPPDAETLRRELLESLEKVSKALTEIKEHDQEERINSRWSTPARTADLRTPTQSPSKNPHKSPGKRATSPANGWHQISGMHMLDVSTLAIKAAKDYYTQHDHPQRLHQIKTERKIREELLGVMDVLKRMASRNFSGGMREDEATTIGSWVAEVSEMLVKEKRIEAQEARDRKSWRWLAGAWPEEEQRRREHEFMRTFLEDGEVMPEWESPVPGSETPTALLEGLRDGLILVTMHNRILKRSRRQFGRIENYHTDTAKPYRAADNLRFWLKAAELRWEVKIELDVMAVVHGKGDGVWEQFDQAILAWCKAVREEITAEWKAGSVQVPPPIVVAAPQNEATNGTQ